MQTFLPYFDYGRTAACLDRQRLGKQRVENLQILKAIHDPDYGWQNHPAVNMWRGHPLSLVEYQRKICLAWTSRGYKDTCWEKTIHLMKSYGYMDHELNGLYTYSKPSWLLDDRFRESHQSNLVRKNPDHYRQFFPDVPDYIPYVWPV